MSALLPMCVRMLRSQGLLERGASFIIAASGGMDSTVLSHVMQEVARRWKLRLCFAYIHHGLRDEADAELEFVRLLAGRMDAEFRSARVDVRGAIDQPGTSLQEAARRLRYEALERIRVDFGASSILTAHHADDQAETLLAHFLRGSGVRGLMGIRPQLGNVARPLLEASSSDVRAYAIKHELSWMDDASNARDAYRRNAIRHHVIPPIRQYVNPGFHRTLADTAKVFSALDVYLGAQAQALREHAVTTDAYGDLSLAVPALKGYFEFERMLLFRALITEMRGNEPSFDEVQAVENVLNASSGRFVDLGQDIRVFREKEALVFSIVVSLPAGIVITAGQYAHYGAFVFASRTHDQLPTLSAEKGSEIIDLDRTGREWQLRPWRDDDTFVPFGSSGSRRVCDFLASAGYSLRERRRIPVLTGANGIIWVCGVRLDEHAALTAETSSTASIEYFSGTLVMNLPQEQSAGSVIIRGETFVPFIAAEVIQNRIRELADEISDQLNGEAGVFICVLNGAFMFFSDLVRHLGIDCEMDFIKLSSYGESKISSGNVRLIKDVTCEIHGRSVFIIEDIVDTGASIDFMLRHLEKKNPASVKIVTLLHKPASTRFNVALDYVGFEIQPRFVVGYGLDYAQQGRNLPAIYVLNDEKKVSSDIQ
jgi:hypoxanthine phosphoribosyltransferase